jgi:hypothetical protein
VMPSVLGEFLGNLTSAMIPNGINGLTRASLPALKHPAKEAISEA